MTKKLITLSILFFLISLAVFFIRLENNNLIECNKIELFTPADANMTDACTGLPVKGK